MAITDPLVLPADVVITPVALLAPQVRAQLDCDQDDVAITRPHSRVPSKIVDAETAELLRLFAEPRTIVEAVIGYSQTRAADPDAVLVDAFPLLQRLIQSGLLVPPGAAAQQIAPTTQPGERLAGFEVLECVQVLEDSELYQVRRDGVVAALKIARPDAGPLIGRLIAHEAEALALLEGLTVPQLLAHGEDAGRPFLAMSWCAGVPIQSAADDLRRSAGADAPQRVAVLCRRLLDAYAALHARGVLHADVHPRNVLADSTGAVVLIDFGLARLPEPTPHEPPRAGMAFYFEPEYAAAALRGKGSLRASAAGEQYALAALAYQLLTGGLYCDFALERGELLRQIAQEPPLPFAQRGVPPWPAVEAVLGRALSKHPSERFPSVAAFAQAFAAASAMPPEPAAPARADGAPIAADLLEQVLVQLRPGGRWYEPLLSQAPSASVNYGAAGVAYALYRIACARGDAELLALADVWGVRAARAAGQPGAFDNAAAGLGPEVVGRVSAFHTASGVACVQSLIAGAQGDLFGQHSAVERFLVAANGPCDSLDLTLGRSSTLLAAALLLDAMQPNEYRAQTPLLEFGGQTMAAIWEQQAQFGPVATPGGLDLPGLAHGWAGLAYAALRWCQVSGQALPAALPARLDELAALAEPAGRGARWPWKLGQPAGPGNSMPGWCNGSAGYVQLWALAGELLGEERYLRLAEQAAWHTWEQPSAAGSLCCGLAGQSYALLELHRAGGGHDWLLRARALAEQAAGLMRPLAAMGAADLALDQRPESLYKGVVGVAVLLADLTRPAQACQPFFGRER